MAIKTLKKKFFEVKVPLTAAKIFLYASSKEALEGSVVKIDLTRNLKGKNLELRARVKSSGDELTGEPISLELIGSYIRRMMRNGADYVEDSFVISSKDANLRVKPFLITRKKVPRSVRKELRNTARKIIESYIKIRNSTEIFAELTSNRLQKELFLKLKKIYPLAMCEIRIVEIVPEKKVQQARL